MFKTGMTETEYFEMRDAILKDAQYGIISPDQADSKLDDLDVEFRLSRENT